MSPSVRLAVAVAVASVAAFGAAFALAGDEKDPVTPPAAKAAKTGAQPVAFEMGSAPAVRAPTAVGKIPGLTERPEPEVTDPPIDDGTTDNGTTDNGTTDNGTTDNGTTGDGNGDEPVDPDPGD